MHGHACLLSASLQCALDTGHFSIYSKVPIIRTGPIIRTVLIFLGTLQL